MDNREFFRSRFGITQGDLERLLGEALARGGHYADLYLEYKIRDFLSMEESILRNASKNITQGVGIRVIEGSETGYAYADGFDMQELFRAAQIASSIAHGPGPTSAPPIPASKGIFHDLYAVAVPLVDIELTAKLRLLEEADRLSRGYDSRIVEVRVVLANESKHVLIYSSCGDAVSDLQPLTVFQVSCIAATNGDRQIGIRGGGGRVGMEFFDTKPPAHFALDAARQAILLLGAQDAPAGPMEVVLGPGWPGILLHEAIGHGLEADFNRKKLSAFSGRIGQKVSSELCSVVDDGTLPSRRGSLNIHDEGNPTGRTVLIENGILCRYMQDALSARLMGAAPTGNGRRESHAWMPMPRMTNTFMLPGMSTNEEIIRSVRRGLYAANFGGGQVDITNGKFVFSASEAYLIEGGRITAPVRGATLIGNGPDVLTRVSMVGNDLELDEGIGTCGKDGQSVPVGVGTPTIKVDEITVGGTRS
ncbi:MAG TPA: metalloprotease TldD [Acidobacteriota bacterium]|nr:metalloprotease TldD [Acidobacteriota bacterium]